MGRWVGGVGRVDRRVVKCPPTVHPYPREYAPAPPAHTARLPTHRSTTRFTSFIHLPARPSTGHPPAPHYPPPPPSARPPPYPSHSPAHTRAPAGVAVRNPWDVDDMLLSLWDGPLDMRAFVQLWVTLWSQVRRASWPPVAPAAARGLAQRRPGRHRCQSAERARVTLRVTLWAHGAGGISGADAHPTAIAPSAPARGPL